jgi:hypothetical protein
MSNDADIVNSTFIRGQSGPWPNPYLTPEQLLALSDLCIGRDRAIHTIEAFAISPDSDQAVLEFSCLEDPVDGWAATAAGRAVQSRQEIEALLARVSRQDRTIRFEVWLD